MKIVVIGGSGLIGSRLVTRLNMLNHTVVAASRGTGVDAISGKGLAAAMQDADVVIDVTDAPVKEGQEVMDFFQTVTTNLLAAAIDADVQHYIALSVVGAERLADSEYMRAKVEQETLIKASGIPYSILRSTQFFELSDRIALAGTRNGEVHVSQASIQPVAAEEVVLVLPEIAKLAPLNSTVEIAGPVSMPLYELIRYYLNETEDSRQLIDDEHAPYFGAELGPDDLIPGDNPIMGRIKYEDWFHQQLAPQIVR